MSVYTIMFLISRFIKNSSYLYKLVCVIYSIIIGLRCLLLTERTNGSWNTETLGHFIFG